VETNHDSNVTVKIVTFARLSVAAVLAASEAAAFSVLAHEAVVDVLWQDSITALIRERFPSVTPDELKAAHAHAYGGSIIQDLGYYPFGSKLFSDLTHYVRSGDFVVALLRDAQTPEEYAFALGALAHYVTDNHGHPTATNQVVPRLYPKLQAKFGSPIPYEKAPAEHLKVEFGFDVLELAKGRYAPESYRDFIGFAVAKRLLEQAFPETYGIEMNDLFTSVDMAIGTYRWTINGILPRMTKVAWLERHKEIEASQPGITRQRFLYQLSRASYEREWGREYHRPGWISRLLAAILRIVPRVGPFRTLSYRMPDADAELLFMKAFNATVEDCRKTMRDSTTLPDRNLDTGRPARRGDYEIADEAYTKLLEKLNEKPIPAALRDNIIAYFGSAEPESERAREKLRAVRRQ
jgi:hypothetical protein